ncbi:MAG: LytTR family transcriptional regulator, partial [Longicatena sp.]
MLRVAILETQEVAKDIMFELSSLLQKEEWAFQYFTKISQLANAEKEKEFQVIIFHEKFEIPRISQAFVLNKPSRIVIYTKMKVEKALKEILPFARIFYIDRKDIKQELNRI